jgi:hypothetical protein
MYPLKFRNLIIECYLCMKVVYGATEQSFPEMSIHGGRAGGEIRNEIEGKDCKSACRYY